MAFPRSFPAESPFCTLSRDGSVFILHMHKEDNRFSVESMSAILEALQVVEDAFHAEHTPCDFALVTTGEGKFFSNGLDINSALNTPGFFDLVHKFLARVLVFPIPTVAAINGHAFAGGCLLSFAHDVRVMRADKGYLCMNEIELPGPVGPGLAAILRYKIAPTPCRDLLLFAKRFNGEAALKEGMVDYTVKGEPAEILANAKQVARELGKKVQRGGWVYADLKREASHIIAIMYADILTNLRKPFHPSASFALSASKL
ncbi:hypothetical protein BZG36_02314 [Bifiguratus adelaidae]|uniref:Enoyl-CoA hydratase n=1 Tax=Bifiguratus adelaidae TaxID=1938954 RepID=A0A261Y3T3_9FUNG|nr:hypothetical protein BZG36_02314 [Bifiguratus adelaidae]